jgi:predicted ATPase/DNA-binding NarL/FixJ family response regulator
LTARLLTSMVASGVGHHARPTGSGSLLRNAPAELTSFVGRRNELAEVKRLLGAGRLVTLTGTGGVGKTRLAVRAATDLRRAFRDGTWLADLTTLRDPELLAQTVAGALDLRVLSARWVVATLADYLALRQLLLVLDNCEHLLHAAAVFSTSLLGATTSLRILVTSREPLGVQGETVLSVPPLSDQEATALLADRAAAVSGFALDERNSTAATELCRRLDGIPLAIELAAVRLRALTLEEVVERLSDRFSLLVSGNRGALPRQQTLRATFDWSRDLLSPEGRTLWARLSVFLDGFDLEAVADVCSGDGVRAARTFELVCGLVDRSIITRDADPVPARYRMLETIREYGWEMLLAAGDQLRLQRRHRDWFQRLAHRAAPEWTGPDAVRWFDRMRGEHGNLRAALGFCVSEAGEAASGLDIAADLWLYWQARGHLAEGRHWLTALLALAPAEDAGRARALWVAGYLAVSQGDTEAGSELLETALGLARKLGDRRVEAFALQHLGLAALFRQDLVRAAALMRQSLEVRGDVVDPVVAFAFADLGIVEALRGAFTGATDLLENSLRLSLVQGDEWTQAHALWGLGFVSWRLDRSAVAHERLQASVRLFRRIDDRTGIARAVAIMACVWASQARYEEAATLLGAAIALYQSIPASVPAPVAQHVEACLTLARSQLAPPAFEAAYEAGGRMRRGEAIAYALGEAATAAVALPLSQTTELTRRQLEVASAVAEGLTNRQIASRLVIAESTVESHLTHIMNRLGLDSRSQIAGWAHRRDRRSGS